MSENIIVLFDEYGTPTFRDDRESDFFIGVVAAIPSDQEKEIFKKCEEKFGLLKNRPIKNDALSNSRVVDIREIVASLPIQLSISYLDLRDLDFQRVCKLYEEYGNIMRDIYRNVRKRPLAQILHTYVLDHSLFTSICDYAEKSGNSLNASIYLDDWSFPIQDKHISFDLTRSSLEKKITEVFIEVEPQLRIKLNKIELLNVDSDRKRFIDIIASVVSRNFLDLTHKNTFPDILNSLLTNRNMKHSVEDITINVKDFMIDFMDKTARGN